MINDSFQVNETIKGFYILEQDGKIIAKGHNMIVNTGRQFLFDVFTSKFGRTSTPYEDYYFYRLYAGKQLPTNLVTTAETTLDNIKNEIITKPGGSTVIDENFYRVFDTENGKLNGKDIIYRNNQIQLEVQFTGTAYAQCISSFFITFITDNESGPNTETETLFSRFVIDPIYLVSGSSYNLKYYISF